MDPKKLVYLDYNATSPMRPEALECVHALQGRPLNASAVHAFGREGRKIIEQSRRQIAALVGADPANVVFNSGATEGNNTVLQYFGRGRVLVSAIEHPSVLEVLPHAELIPVTSGGVVDLEALEALLADGEKPELVSVMLVNNETGIVQPVAAVSALARQYGAFVHCDAVQAAGRMAISISELGVDFMTLSSHKIGGPQGVGALVMGLCGETPVLLRGGGQEKKARAGTEDVAGISGFGAAAHVALESLGSYQELGALRRSLEEGISRMTPQIRFYGEDQDRAANTSLFSFPGVSSETLMIALDLEGVCVSNGSACSSGKVEQSYVLKAMGVADDCSSSALRVSMGWDTVQEDVERFLQAWEACSRRFSKV